LSVDVVGVFVAIGPRETKPALVWLTTVRLPVTAMAPAGTPPRPAMAQVRDTLAVNLPARPLATRVSSRRTGVTVL
jgi:hypothetical protein